MLASELLNYKNWVVIGDVENTNKYAIKILNALLDSGFNVKGVNPRSSSEKVYNTLKKIPYKIDVIDLCINPIDGISILKEVKELGINNILVQPGAGSDAIKRFCIDNKINYIQGCALVELNR
ncbi:hypothetical protein CLOACE_17460 [Clostridium acetireducens DSM 10703]|uniref:CoA-binding domain-containing protein n=1 Tax=Clostridium acetireducens DSM 10703 TaxID=1121290 RepID=A0A1E8EX46_9CLOT|nr:CoA-binding protein [Clostridium acetireducens]OFI05369.1 hypothetical protein CLOACE_17460 [Clostridium acetireducens DSM 10703]